MSPHPQTHPSGPPSTGASLRGLRVLVIEDCWNVAHTIKSILEKAGARVLGPVPSAAQAIGIIEREAVSLALIDMNLRGSFADEVVDELAARGIPHAIVTGYETLPTDADRSAAVVLRKPVDASELIGFVSRYVAG
jgi:DNA-binding NtrC family response regulator